MEKDVEKQGTNLRKIWNKRLNHQGIMDIIRPDGQNIGTVSSD